MSEDLQNIVSNEVEENISLNSESLDKLLSVFDTVSRLCTDISIVNGKICQHSDKKSSILSIDVSSILNDNSFFFSSIGSKNELLEPFRKQQASVELVTNESTYIIKDEFSHLLFTKPLLKYLNNKYMTDEELTGKLMIDDEQIFSYELKKFLVERLTAMQKGLAATMVKIVFKGDVADFLVTTSDNSSNTTGKVITVPLEREVEGECVFPIQPFLLGNDDVLLTCFFRNDGANLLLNFNSTVRDIPISVWCISKIVSAEEDED